VEQGWPPAMEAQTQEMVREEETALLVEQAAPVL
jgi:hypothetical protein